MDNNENILTLNDEKGNPVQFELLDNIQRDDQEYVVLLPVTDSDEIGEVVILQVKDTEDTEFYVSIDDNNTLQKIFELFKERNKDIFTFVD